jgi:DNA-binding NtrC family response regulator
MTPSFRQQLMKMKKKILIVEDEFVVANDLGIMLEASGYETTGIAVSVNAAMEEIAKNIPDLVLLDIQLQGTLSGIDLARQLKARHIAFVYLSANSDQKTLQKAKATEPYGFLVKPVRSRDLLVTLDIACYRHEHGLEAFLFRKDRLRRELALLVNEQNDRATILARFAESLQMVVPFDFLCFACSTQNAGYQFCGLNRSGFNEYQEINKTGLGNIAAKSISEVDLLLSTAAVHQPMQRFTEDTYIHLMGEDPLANVLHRAYAFQSVIRGSIGSPALPHCRVYVFNKEANRLDDRQVAVVEEIRDLLVKLIAGVSQEKRTIPAHMGTGVGNAARPVLDKFIGKSKSISHCLDLVAQVAPLNTSVLITGESGTGKELFAEAIYQLSQRNRQPFIRINCAALPYTLIESELFGYEKGAFTGALTSRMGKFEAASGGTIFLDEIGEMSLDVQAKLLRVLQEKKVQRVGSHKMIEADVRIIAATNRDLEKAVAEHRFRLDLYFRLNVFPIQLPSLRDRKEDIALLADHLGRHIARAMGREYHGIAPGMMEALEQYEWPGNVRELENVIERTLIISGSNKPMTLLQPLTSLRTPADTLTTPGKFSTIDEIKQRQELDERLLIETALRETKGKIRGPGGAAEKLDIKPTTLESRLIRLGIRKESFQ